MDIFDKITKTLSEAGKEGVNKAKELRDTTKISMDIKDREVSIQRMYREIGKAYYQDHKNDVEPEYDQVKEITNTFEEIEELKSSKDELRGVKRCQNCGHVLKEGAKFCENCGAEVKSDFEDVDIVNTPEDDGSDETVEATVVSEDEDVVKAETEEE